jgi:threonine/homoserine/homoserine lactone efflux protein
LSRDNVSFDGVRDAHNMHRMPVEMSLLLAVLPFAASTTFTPGPNNLMVMASAANFGMRRSFAHMLGVALGFPVMLVALGAGFGTTIAQSETAHAVLRIVGAGYMIFLAWRIATAAAPGQAAARGRPMNLIEAALFQWVNPKAWAMALGIVTTYTTVGGNVLLETALIGLIFVPMALAATALWGACGAALRNWLQSPRALVMFNVTMALLLVLSLVPLFWP